MERQGMDAMDGRQSMDARAWKEPEGYRVDAPQQLKKLCYCPVSTRGVA